MLIRHTNEIVDEAVLGRGGGLRTDVRPGDEAPEDVRIGQTHCLTDGLVFRTVGGASSLSSSLSS